jgi:hypothetical protein
VFTIHVNINNKDAKSHVQQDCATDGNFQMIAGSTQTSDAFKSVLTKISKLRVSKQAPAKRRTKKPGHRGRAFCI